MHEDDFEIITEQHGSMEEEIIRNAFKKDRTIYIWDEINNSKALIVTRMLEKLSPRDSEVKKPIYISINSPGGEVYSSFAIISAIEKAKNNGYDVIARIDGIAMSMAVSIVCVCSYAIASLYSRFLIHDVSALNIGFMTRADSRENLDEQEELWKKMDFIFQKYTKVKSDWLDEITAHKRNYSFWAEEALELGIVDEIE